MTNEPYFNKTARTSLWLLRKSGIPKIIDPHSNDTLRKNKVNKKVTQDGWWKVCAWPPGSPVTGQEQRQDSKTRNEAEQRPSLWSSCSVSHCVVLPSSSSYIQAWSGRQTRVMEDLVGGECSQRALLRAAWGSRRRRLCNWQTLRSWGLHRKRGRCSKGSQNHLAPQSIQSA